MRAAFIDQLINEARTNERVYLLVGDLGYNVIEPFAREFPDRFRNVGIAEQNMAGIAAGLAMTGYNVYFYSIGNFPTLRCIEQIRNDIAYHHLSVKVVAVGGGFAYADLGATHHATEAIGMLRTIPNMVVCSPADPQEARAITTLSASYDGPMYIQLGKAGEKNIWDKNLALEIGDILLYRKGEGHETAVLTSGSIAADVVANEKCKDMDIYTVPFVKPLNKKMLVSLAQNYKKLFVVEENQKSCGIGSAIVEQMNDLYADGSIGFYSVINRIAIDDCFSEVCGSQRYLRIHNRLSL